MLHDLPVDRLGDAPGPGQGLSGAEVELRRRRYGPNDILEAPATGRLDVLRDALRDPMIWFLVGAAMLFAVAGDAGESLILAAAIAPILGMDAWLHRRTRASTAGLAGRLASRARVLRDGVAASLPAVELVPGDLATVGTGESFPADGLIVAGAGLQVDESALTGEALPVRKRPAAAPIGGRGVDDAHVARAGTRLLTGEAQVRIVYTGGDTLYGQIVRSVRSGGHERTPLQREIASLVAVLLAVAVALCLVLTATRLLQGHGLVDALLSGATLAIAAIPEEFPVVFTFFLGVGVYRLARVEALVRRAVAVEDIGRISCICCDKTGTLTEGRLLLAHVEPATGVAAAALLAAAAGASRSAGGDPLDLAILQHAPERPARAVFPFTEDRRREVAIVDDGGARLALAKGAAEAVLPLTRLDAAARARWHARVAELAASGHKVIACARRVLGDWPGGEPDRDYDFLGLLAFEDPVRAGVVEAVAQASAAGIRVIMVTGDHPATAAAVAREIGIGAGQPRIVEGEGLAQRLRAGDAAAAREYDVVARCLPATKLELVRALRAAGETVAVTGDGVNDVPALQGADVGIAMGARGTRSAREVAAIVLLDDNFRTIVRAIGEGRQLFENLRLSFAYLLVVHLPLVLTAALIPFAGYPLLYLPIHVVWLELLIHPTALLVFQQRARSGPLAPVARAARVRFFDRRQWLVIAAAGALITALVLAGYGRGLGAAGHVEHARSLGLLVLVLASAGITAGLTGLAWRAARIAVAATVASAVPILQVPALAAALHLTPLHAGDWAAAAIAGLATAALCRMLRVAS